MNLLLHDDSGALHEPDSASDHRDYARDSGETGEDFGTLASVQSITSPRIQTGNDYKQANHQGAQADCLVWSEMTHLKVPG